MSRHGYQSNVERVVNVGVIAKQWPVMVLALRLYGILILWRVASNGLCQHNGNRELVSCLLGRKI